MLKLIKFEFFRKRMSFLLAFVLVAIVQFAVSLKFFSVEIGFRKYYVEDLIILYLLGLFFCFSLLFLIDIITLFRNDLFKKEGYMLFLTPNSGYQILGSKLIFALLEGICIFLIFIVIVFMNLKMLYGSELMTFISIEHYFLPLLVKICFLLIIGLIEFALTIYLAFAIFKSTVNNKRFKGLITFLIFIGLGIAKNLFFNFISRLFVDINVFDSVETISFTEFLVLINNFVNVSLILSVVASCLLFWATGHLIERKINL